ncbi:hypothetical protein [Limisphaera sp. VF-2]|jgi:hypothetical protein|uniref:hypothetical protein n=1 Tax=Limisphaera sp. VF-2 TaxID=3400418 RepID=UPI00176F234F
MIEQRQTHFAMAKPESHGVLPMVALLAVGLGNVPAFAAAPAAHFTATVRLTPCRDDGTPGVTRARMLEGCLFADGFHVWSTGESEGATYFEACAVVSNTVYSLTKRITNGTQVAYQALLEQGFVSRFLSMRHQIVALALGIADRWEDLAQGKTKVLLTLGEPYPEYYNTYLVERGSPQSIHVVARAPNFALCSTGIVFFPKPYDVGFTLWTLDVEYSPDGRPASARFQKYVPLDEAIGDVQMGRTPQRLEALISSAEVLFTWAPSFRMCDRLPIPPQLPFYIDDYRFVFDTYTNNRLSAMVEGGARLLCTNVDWSYPLDKAMRASMFVQRGLAARDAALRRGWLGPLFLVICAAALVVPALLVWRKGGPTQSNGPNPGKEA